MAINQGSFVFLTMLNIKVTNRMLHEDYVAMIEASPYVLPKKHLLSVAITVILCSALVLPMPSTWKYFSEQNQPVLTVEGEAYLASDQSQNELDAQEQSQVAPVQHQENYDDYDIPSELFQNNSQINAASEALAESSSNNENNSLLTDTQNTDEVTPIIIDPAAIKGSWADGTQKAGTEDSTTSASDDQALAQTDTTNTVTDTDTASSDKDAASAVTPDTEKKETVLADTGNTNEARDSSNTDQTAAATGTEVNKKTDDGKMLAANDNAQTGSAADGSAGATEADAAAAAGTDAQPVVAARPEGSWYLHKIESGESLSAIFAQLGLPYATLNRITRIAQDDDLKLKVGDPIFLLIDKDNVVMEMVKYKDKEQQVRFTRMTASTDFEAVYEDRNTHAPADIITAAPDAATMPLAVEVQKEREEKARLLAKAAAEKAARDKANNVNPNRPRLIIDAMKSGETFATAGHRAGLTPSEIKNIEQIFGSKLNFSKLKSGDKFRVLFDGIGTNALISAIQFETAQGHFSSYINPEDKNYYSETEFTPTAGIFRRFPLAGEIKVNSQFNPHRRHPVTKRVSPHNGVDFKAPIGTPVYAPADGVVSFSGYQRAAGYYVIVKHANNYSTVYMHLSKSEVKRGQKVIVGQVIARTGNTGRTTGPHLHYEIRINDRAVNPLKVKLPSNKHPNLAREQREAFANNVKLLRAELHNDKLAQVTTPTKAK